MTIHLYSHTHTTVQCASLPGLWHRRHVCTCSYSIQLLWNHCLQLCNHIWGKNATAMVLLVGPCYLSTRQTLTYEQVWSHDLDKSPDSKIQNCTILHPDI